MQPAVIFIPTLNDSAKDFEVLFEIWSRTNIPNNYVRFDFSRCGFLRPNAVAFIGGMARQIQSKAGAVEFDWHSFTNQKVLNNIKLSGFAAKFDYSGSGWTGNTIPYREDAILDDNSIMDYLTDKWIGRGWLDVSNRLKNAVAGKMWEIYCNAFEHAGSGIGVFSCGQHFPRANELVLSVVDFGLGIAKNVRLFLSSDPRASQLTAAQCLRWAFGPGHTTRPNGMARGIGLDFLKAFIKVNHGKLEVYSNEGYALIDHDNEVFLDRSTSFDGTIIHITLICDENRYLLSDEI